MRSRFATPIGYDAGMKLPIPFLIPFVWIFAALGPRQALKSNRNVRLWFAVLAVLVTWFGGAIADLVIISRSLSGEPGWGGDFWGSLDDLMIWLLLFGPSIPALISLATCFPKYSQAAACGQQCDGTKSG